MKDLASHFKKALSSTINLIPSKKFKLYIPSIFDLLFFLVYGFLTAGIYAKIKEHAYALNAVLVQNSGTLAQLYSQGGLVDILQQSDIIRSIAWKIILLIIFLAITIFIIYTIFQGIAWRLSLNFTGKFEKFSVHRKLQTLYSIRKENLNDYLKKFLLINLIWFPIFCIYYLTSFVFYLLDTLKDRTSPSIGSVITYAFFLILIYFTTISYVFIQRHKTWRAIKITFKTGVLKIHYCILPYALLVIILLIWNVVFEKIALLNPYLAFVFALLIVLPTITLARILLGHTIQKL